MNKREQMNVLIARAEQIRAAACAPGIRVVFGEGDLNARLMIVGEAPGADEDRIGTPFVGTSGKLLDQELVLAGLSRDSIYITASVKCRPTVLRDCKTCNRAPNPKEIAAWYELLMQEIQVISPQIILCVGSVAANNLIHPQFKIAEERGRWFDGVTGVPTMATFHPAYINRWKRSPDALEHRQFREDLLAVAEAAGFRSDLG